MAEDDDVGDDPKRVDKELFFSVVSRTAVKQGLKVTYYEVLPNGMLTKFQDYMTIEQGIIVDVQTRLGEQTDYKPLCQLEPNTNYVNEDVLSFVSGSVNCPEHPGVYGMVVEGDGTRIFGWDPFPLVAAKTA